MTLGPDAGPPKSDATVDQAAPDAGGDAATGPRLLMTYAATNGELVSYDVAGKAVAARATLPGYEETRKSASDFFLLGEGSADVVAKLAPGNPTSPIASWNVHLDDGFDGGEANANPVDIVETAPTKAYVLRYNRNRIAVIDPSQSADGGAPVSTIDLSALMQANDHDGHVDMTGAVFDASRNRLYVALGNIDINLVDPQGFFLLCAGTQSTLIAVDTTNDTLVNLGGSGPGGGVVLNGYSPQTGTFGGVVLDTAGDRVLVFSTGCNAPGSGDAGAGPLSGRLVEAVDLKTNQTTTLLDASAQPYPGQLAYLDATHALIQFGFGAFSTTYAWDPTKSTLGAPFATTPDVFDLDGKGHFLGPQSTIASDGGAGPTNVIAVDVGDGGVAQLGQNPFLQSAGFVGNATYVP
ncbi:MAG TPA: hypothetical protein VGH28_31930 [Polyangiaceae bacterium]